MNHSLITEFTRRAMATNFVVMLPENSGTNVEIAVTSLAEVDRIEDLLSVYRPQSDISRLNQAAGRGPVSVSSETFEVLSRAVELARLTRGAFDVTAGPLVDVWGFTKRQGAKPSQDAIKAAMDRVGYEKLLLDPLAQTAELLDPGMAVNLGAIGKGFALDYIAAKLESAGVDDFLLHGGRSSVLARGDDIPQSNSGWKVALEHPRIPGKRLGGVRLRNQSLGTSGSGKQFFHHQGKRLGHVIDPRTGWPSSELLSVTIVCRSAMDADALATALFVMGEQGAVQFIESLRSEVSGLAGGSPLMNDIGLITVAPTSRQADVDVSFVNIGEHIWLAE